MHGGGHTPPGEGNVMSFVLALLLMGVLGSKIPTDEEIAARIEAVIMAQLHPTSVSVTVQRPSRFSTTITRLEIVLNGCAVDNLPMAVAAPAATPTPAPTPAAPDAAMPDPTGIAPPPLVVQPSPKEKQLRIIDFRLQCDNLTLAGMPIRALAVNAHEVRVPWSSVECGAIAVTTAESATGTVLIREEGITQFLAAHPIPLDNAKVDVTPAGLTVRGKTEGLVGLPVAVSGKLAARGKAVLYLANPKLKVSVLNMPAGVTKRVLKGVNPLADLNADLHLPVPVTLTQVTHLDNAVRFDLTMQFAK
jgi:hypothetical protein